MANVCQTYGDRGFEEALVSCDSCKIEVVHRYCMGITPVPLTEYLRWFCEDCDGSDSEYDPEGDDNDPDWNDDTDSDGNDSDYYDNEEPEAKDIGTGWRKSRREIKPNPKYMD